MAEEITLSRLLMEADKSQGRQRLLDIEAFLNKQDGAVNGDSDLCPLNHHFADGVYAREISIPEGTIIVGKIHKDDHHVFLMRGTLCLMTEFETKEVVAPCHFISKAGSKRAAIALTDVVWTTIHANTTNTQNLEKLEDEIIAKNYLELDKYIASKSRIGFFKKILNLITR